MFTSCLNGVSDIVVNIDNWIIKILKSISDMGNTPGDDLREIAKSIEKIDNNACDELLSDIEDIDNISGEDLVDNTSCDVLDNDNNEGKNIEIIIWIENGFASDSTVHGTGGNGDYLSDTLSTWFGPDYSVRNSLYEELQANYTKDRKLEWFIEKVKVVRFAYDSSISKMIPIGFKR